jgi:hypothetical protein
MAQWHANLCGLGEIFDKAQVKTALASLYKYNFIPRMREIANFWRNYCLNDEGGLLIATWPQGKYCPVVPLPYETETQNGYEYQALIHMIQEGLVDEGLRGVAAIRERYDGAKRNPWNEFECGSNYARSMASYSLLLTFSGFAYDMTKGHVGFAPLRYAGAPEQLRYFWSVQNAWGTYVYDDNAAVFNVTEGALTLCSFAPEAGAAIAFAAPVTIQAGEGLRFVKEDGRWKRA